MDELVASAVSHWAPRFTTNGVAVADFERVTSGLKDWDKLRYGSLVHPGDAYSYDIFSQAGDALRHPKGINPLGGLTVRTMLATGRSQSAFRLVTYINAVHPLTHLFDGYLVHSRGANTSGFNAEGLARDAENPVPPGALLRQRPALHGAHGEVIDYRLDPVEPARNEEPILLAEKGVGEAHRTAG